LIINLLSSSADTGRIFGIDQQMMISVGIQLINACILAAALSFILYKPVRNFMNKRADNIKSQFDSAEESKAKAEELKALYEKKINDIEDERIDVLNTAKIQASENNKNMIDEAKKEISLMRERAELALETEREHVDEEIKHYIIEVASAIAEKFIADTIDEDTHKKLFDEMMSELEEPI